MSENTVFISYRRDVAGRSFARSIKQALTHKGYDVFLDVDCIGAGQWAEQILTQVPKRAHFLLLLTPGALDRCSEENDWVRKEFLAAVQAGRNIVPVREESVIVADLKKSCPESMQGLFSYQMATVRHAGFAQDVETLIERYIPPHKAPGNKTGPASPGMSFRAEISRVVEYAPAQLIGRDEEKKLISDAWEKAVRGEQQRPHILTFVAFGGEGKTSLVAKWAIDEMNAKGWPNCDAAFAWSFYSQGAHEQVAASSDLFLKEALTFFGDPTMASGAQSTYEKGRRLAQLVGEQRALLLLDGLEPLQYAPTSPTPGELKDQGISALLKGLAGNSCGLCIVTTRYSLPDLKAFWQTTAPEKPLARLSNEAGVHLLQQLGVRKESGSKADFEKLVEDVKGHALTLTLLGGFLKRAFHGDIRQRARVKFEKADEKMDGGHAFRTMAAYEQWLLRDGGDEGPREVAVLRLMGLFDRPADAGCLAALRRETIPGLTEPLAGLADDDWEFCLSGLEATKLLTVNRDASGALVSLDAHPHLRAYFAKQLSEQTPEAWRAGHKRLYEHLCATTQDKPQPTLEDLQPLYQAVAHGCQAGLQQEVHDKVYWQRISRGWPKQYSIQKLGAFGADLGALACFFELPWSKPWPTLKERDQVVLLANSAAFLRAVGRLTEALELMRASAAETVNLKSWKDAAIVVSNLSELELTLGEVPVAVGNAERSVTYAERSGDAFQRMVARSVHADALHQEGRRAEAEARFREAEQMQADRQPLGPLLYSVQGFRYCDLLLTKVERAAWQKVIQCFSPRVAPQTQLGTRLRGTTADDLNPETTLAAVRAVSERASQTLKWMENDPGATLLTIPLEHLTLGRAAFYAAILESLSSLPLDEEEMFERLHRSARVNLPPAALQHIESAVSGLRRAGQQQYLVLGLLTRAWLRRLSRAPTGPSVSSGPAPGSAQEDLDEALEIAERGPMKLHLADIHLYRARLFFREAHYPWDTNPDDSSRGPKDDLAAARKLIEQCGYWRRGEELEDAEAVILYSGT